MLQDEIDSAKNKVLTKMTDQEKIDIHLETYLSLHIS